MLFSQSPDFSLTLLEKVFGAGLGILLSAAGFFAGRWWGRVKAGREWRDKTFLGRCIISLNLFHEGTLKIRTVMERDLAQVFLNQIAVEKVLAAAKLTTKENPILPVAKEDRWYLLNFALNAVAEHFSAGHVKRDAGVPVSAVTYGLFLTCEQVGDERIRKVRVMLLKKESLETFPYPDEMPTLENPWHEDRVKTLRAASALFRKEPDHFLTLEVCV
jgi:hypothetical protein